MDIYLEVSISAENSEQAKKILDALLGQKLVTGGQLLNSPARFLWKGETQDMNYVVIKSFTLDGHKDKIIEVVRKNSVEEVLMVWFTAIEGNEQLLQWISDTLS